MAGASRELSLAELAADMRATANGLSGNISFREPLQVSQTAIVADVKENFAGGHDPEGSPWLPLAHPRPSSRGSDIPLRDKGLLMASVVSANGQGSIRELTDSYLVMGTNLEYAQLHQEGGVIEPKGHPYLAIPLTKEAARAGSPLNFGADLTPIFGAKGGVLVERVEKGRGKNKRTEDKAHYALTPRVVIPARPFLGFGGRLIDTIMEIFSDWWGRKCGA